MMANDVVPLRNPDLYTEMGTPALAGAPALRAVKSRNGHISYPPQHYGCQLTGDTGDNLVDVLLTGCGRLRASSTVHIHARPLPKTPFTVVEVAMDDGPLVRGLLAQGEQTPLASGTVLFTCLEEIQNEAGDTLRDLRFTTRNPALTLVTEGAK